MIKLSIKERRIALGLTQKDLAGRIGVDQSAVAQWERNVTGPHRNKLVAIAKALECTVDDLLKDDEGGEENGET